MLPLPIHSTFLQYPSTQEEIISPTELILLCNHLLLVDISLTSYRPINSNTSKLNTQAMSDPISRLSIELSRMIFGYLSFHECFQLQRVSKTWNALLSTHGVEHINSIDPTIMKPGERASTVAARLHAFREGGPFGTASLRFKNARIPYAYAEGLLAYVDEKRHQRTRITLLNLGSHHETTLNFPEGGTVRDLAMSSAMVVAEDTRRNFHVWSSAADRFVTKIPSRRIAKAFALAKKTFVFIINKELNICVLGSLEVEHLKVSVKLSGEIKLLLDSEGKTLFLFCRDDYRVTCNQFDLCGRLISSQSIVHELDCRDPHRSGFFIDCPGDILHGPTTTLWAITHKREGAYGLTPKQDIHRICYELSSSEFKIVSNNIDLPTYNPHQSPFSHLFIRHDIAYFRAAIGHWYELIRVNFEKDQVDVVKGLGDAKFWWFQGEARVGAPNIHDWPFQGDQRFLIQAGDYGVLILSFDKDHQLPACLEYHTNNRGTLLSKSVPA